MLYCGGTGFYISPISFLKDPLVWMRALSKYQGTHTQVSQTMLTLHNTFTHSFISSQAPNFAYALVVRKFKEYHQNRKNVPLALDLSSLRHMINAAEPIDSSVVISFNDTFSPFGLPANVLKPTYGLAEHTVFVCSDGSQILRIVKSKLEQGQVEVLAQQRIADLGTASGSAASTTVTSDYQDIIGCGYPNKHETIRVLIVNHETSEVQPDQVVGIWKL